ncbi:MAG: sugar kinase [Hyphomicrobiaceae bacterium]
MTNPSTTGTPALCIGECMVELSRGNDGRYDMAFGGDTFNTAVYLARCGTPVRYATALGDDAYSASICDLARSEGILTDCIDIRANRMPGLYLIETSPAGERSFNYWRDTAPAREVFDHDRGLNDRLGRAIRSAPLAYFSGITLSLYSPAGLERFAELLAEARVAGATIAMDGNYRPRGWKGDADRARAVMERFWRLADVALPTFDDEAALWDDTSTDQTLQRLSAFGVTEVAVKLGAEGALCGEPGVGLYHVRPPVVIAPVDTTAAGDSFNAAYLATRLSGGPPALAGDAGNRLAGIVIQHRGAIVPRSATDGIVGAPPCA